MYAGAPLSLGRVPQPGAGRAAGRTGCRRPSVISPLAFIVANLLIYWSGFEALWKLGICIVIGYVLIGVCMAFDAERPPLDWKRSSPPWLPVYLIGMGIISWQGQYSGGRGRGAAQHRPHPVLVGHPGGRGVQPDDLLLGAMRGRLPREEMRAGHRRAGGRGSGRGSR